MSLLEIVFVSVALELALVWVLRVRTRLIKRVKLERLMYVAGIATALTSALAWMLASDLAGRVGGTVFGLLCLLPVVVAVEAVAFRLLGRLLWRQAWIFGVVTNVGSFLALMALVALEAR